MSDTKKPALPTYSRVKTGDSGLRIAHALEHIAEQLTQINAKMDLVTAPPEPK